MASSPDAFTTAIRSLVSTGSDPFRWWWLGTGRDYFERDPPCYIGLLAAFSLAASESGASIDGEQRSFFHRQLAHILGIKDVDYVRGFGDATSLYYSLEEYLRNECNGLRGALLVASKSFGGKYVWRARVQVLLNASSRRQLALYFDRRCLSLGELRKSDLLKLFLSELEKPSDYVLSQSLRRTFEIVREEGEEPLDGFMNLVETEYVSWFFTNAERLKRTAALLKTGTTPTQSRRNPIVEAVLAQGVGLARRRQSQLAFEKRLVLRSGLGNAPWQVWVQLRYPGSDWINSSAVFISWNVGLISYELKDGATRTMDLDDRIFFQSTTAGWISTSELRAGDLCAILSSTQDLSSLNDLLLKIDGVNPILRRISCASDAAVLTMALPRATIEQLPEELRTLIRGDAATLTFRRGLRYMASYFAAGPPRVYFDHATILQTTISLNHETLPEPILRRVEYALPRTLSVGDHYIEVLGRCRMFTLSDENVPSKMDLFDCAGYEICTARGIAIPSKAPGTSANSSYNGARVHILVGAVLL